MAQTQVTHESHALAHASRRDPHALLRRRRQALGISPDEVSQARLPAWLVRLGALLSAPFNRPGVPLLKEAQDATAADPTPSPSHPVPPPGMALTTPFRAMLPKVIASVLAVITVAVLLRGLLTPATPAPTVTASSTPAPAGPGVGHLAPDVTLLDLNGKPVKLSSLRGTVVVLNFWYVACSPCQIEMPALEKTYLAEKANGFEVVGVDTADSAADITTFVTRLGVTYPILRDTALNAVDAYGVTATPTSYVIDKRGVIRDRILGPVNETALTSEVSALVQESSG